LIAILKEQEINAIAIALNIGDEHFEFTMSSVGASKVDKMMLEKEFSHKAVAYCDTLNKAAQREERIDFIEVNGGKVHGYCLDDEARAMFQTETFLDDQILFVAKMMLIANRWFDAKIDADEIPHLIVKYQK